MALGTTLSRLHILLNVHVHLEDLEAQAQSLTFANSVVTYIQYECYWIREEVCSMNTWKRLKRLWTLFGTEEVVSEDGTTTHRSMVRRSSRV